MAPQQIVVMRSGKVTQYSHQQLDDGPNVCKDEDAYDGLTTQVRNKRM